MNNYRFVLIFIILVNLLSIPTNAQSLHYGFHLGGGVSTIIEKSDFSSPVEKSYKFGFKAGLSAEFELMDFFNVGASISFFQKGQKIKDDFATSKLSLGYFDIPIYVGASVPIGDFKLTGFVGPYTSVAVVGKRTFKIEDEEAVPNFEWNFDDNSHDEYVDETQPVFSEEINSYKRFDTGISAGIMFGYNNYRLSATYSRGLRDIKPNETIKANNSSINISVIYFLR
ncbi:MAG: porin family protein [Bacteroidales bacterium]|jgi:hypothetical protein|nr:porin family protein [Bacteroidales bacterium]MDD4235827.1 porin family protein [Bacteroidales bacterium]MDY0160195.1 porin family protein [Bacteroidales bacterium]